METFEDGRGGCFSWSLYNEKLLEGAQLPARTLVAECVQTSCTYLTTQHISSWPYTGRNDCTCLLKDMYKDTSRWIFNGQKVEAS